MQKYQIFISYRRNGGEYIGKIIYDALSQMGYITFLDICDMVSGKFNDQLFSAINAAEDFILILSKHSLDRCGNIDDWPRKEIEEAIRLKKNIILLITKDFIWPDNIPESISEIRYYQGIFIHIEYFQSMIMQLEKYLCSTPARISSNAAIYTPAHTPSLLMAELRSIESDLLSRKHELNLIEENFTHGRKQVFLWGFGGLGKTTTALMYAHSKQARQRFSRIYFIQFYDNLRKTIINLKFENYSEQNIPGVTDDDIYNQKLLLLSRYKEDTLLIIDNFDSERDTLDTLRSSKEYGDLCQCRLSLLFTTRYHMERQGIRICEFKEEELIQRFYHFCDNDLAAPKKEVIDLIRLLNRHTLMIELIARMINESYGCLDLKTIINNIHNHTWDSDEYYEIGASRGYIYEEKRLLDHLRGLFHLSNLKEEESIILTYAALTPETGISSHLFMKCLNPKQQNCLRILVKKGWIQYNADAKSFLMHMLIRELCTILPDLQPTYQTCNSFLNALWNEYQKNDKAGNLQITEQVAITYDHFSTYDANLSPEESLLFYERIAYLYHDIGYYPRERAIRQKKRVLFHADDTKQHIEELLLIAKLSDELGMFDEALEETNNALEYIKQMKKSKEKDYLAACCYNLRGFIIADIEGSGSPKAYADKISARKIFDTIDKTELNSILNLHYLAYSETYHKNGYSIALEHAFEAINLLENKNKNRRIRLLEAEILNNIGFIYEKMDYEEKAIFYKKEALEIRKQYLPFYHPDMAQSYSNIANSYYKIRHPEAIEYADAAIKIRKQIFGESTPSYISTVEAKKAYLLNLKNEERK